MECKRRSEEGRQKKHVWFTIMARHGGKVGLLAWMVEKLCVLHFMHREAGCVPPCRKIQPHSGVSSTLVKVYENPLDLCASRATGGMHIVNNIIDDDV